MKWIAFVTGIIGVIAALFGADLAIACSRVLWADNGVAVVVGRNMDWPQDMQTDLWAFPRGIARAGLNGDTSAVTWTSKYGSVAASVYGLGTADGINEKGLVANVLWLTEADYGKRDPRVPGLSLSLWAQYVLDNFATVAEAVDSMQKHPIQIVPLKVPGNDAPAPVHMALADASGDSAIIEIVDGGKFRIHHSRAYAVMTNSPPFPEQLANLKKYQGFGGSTPLPGTSEAADRFVRAAYYLQNLTKPKDVRETVAEILSVMRNVAQPSSSSRRRRIRKLRTPSGARSPTPPTVCISSNRRSPRTSSGCDSTIWISTPARRCASSISCTAAISSATSPPRSSRARRSSSAPATTDRGAPCTGSRAKWRRPKACQNTLDARQSRHSRREACHA